MELSASTRKVAGGCGIVAVALFVISWAIGALADPDWVLGEKSLSRMGLSDIPLTANLFNLACIVCGGLGIVPAWIKAKHGSTPLNRLTGAVLLVSCFSLMGVGFVQIDDSVDVCFHDVIAFLFFGSAIVSMCMSIVAEYTSDSKLSATVTLVMIAIFIVAYFTTVFGVYEAIGVLTIMVWICMQSVKVITGKV